MNNSLCIYFTVSHNVLFVFVVCNTVGWRALLSRVSWSELPQCDAGAERCTLSSSQLLAPPVG